MTVSLASLQFRRPARPAKAGLAVLRAGALPAAKARRVPRTRAGHTLVALTPLDSLLINESSGSGTRGAAAEGRAGRMAAARSLLVGGIAAGMLVAVALTGVIVMVAGIVRSFAEL